MAKDVKYPYPSQFGSHSEMVIGGREDGSVVCEDAFGTYETTTAHLDTGEADPNRNGLRNIL